MPSNDHLSERLTQAGQRAAGRHGLTAPPLDSIRVEVARRQRSQRTFGGVAVAVVLLAVVPIAAFFFGRSTSDSGVVTAASDGQAAAAVDLDQAAAIEEPPIASSAVGEALDSLNAQDRDFAADLDENIDVQIQIGDRSYSLEVIVDDQAPVRAAEAEAAADDTRLIDDTTIWLRDLDGQTEASALVDDGVFAAATGPSDEVIDALDDLTEFAEQAAPLLNGDLDLEGLLGDDFADSFGEDFDPESFLGPDFNIEEFLGPDFDPNQFFGEDFDPESFVGPDAELEQFFGPDFDPQEFFEGLPFDLEGLGDGELDLGNLFGQLEDLQECFGPALEEANETGSFILPDCDIEELTTT